jgi:hypothetical protein
MLDTLAYELSDGLIDTLAYHPARREGTHSSSPAGRIVMMHVETVNKARCGLHSHHWQCLGGSGSVPARNSLMHLAAPAPYWASPEVCEP